MKRRSDFFKPGQRIENTMFTIIDSVRPDSWSEIRCACDCGREVVLSYYDVYRKRFSCGCKRRESVDAVDHTNAKVHNKNGNQNSGRTLTVLYKDPETQQWVYMCHCCASVRVVPRGSERGLLSTLYRIAGERCDEFRTFIAVANTGMLTRPFEEMGFDYQKLSRGSKQASMELLAHYYHPWHVERDRSGAVLGLYGMPDFPMPDEWRLSKKTEPFYEQVPEDIDGFGSMAEYK